jgi:protein TonB
MRIFFVLLIAILSTVLLSSFRENRSADVLQNIVLDTVPVNENTIVYEKVEVAASVNMVLWRQHLERQLMPVIEKAAKKKMKAGTYQVFVRFLVERNGSISDVVALNDPGFGLAEGAVKVVKTGPKWKPGEVNGKKVRSYYAQPITYVISEK